MRSHLTYMAIQYMTEVRTIDMSPIDGSDNVRFIMRYAAGVQVGVGADIYWGAA